MKCGYCGKEYSDGAAGLYADNVCWGCVDNEQYKNYENLPEWVVEKAKDDGTYYQAY